MELKKSPKADLENKKGLFGSLGLVLTLAIVLVAFEWKSYDKEEIQLAARAAVETEEEVIIQTEQNLPPPPPPPPAQVSDEIEIVEDDVEIENEVEINAEATEETVVEDYVAPPVVVEEEEVAEEEIFQIVEEMPSYPGGAEALYEYLNDNIRYPIVALESGISGRVYVQFVVEKDGSVSDVKVLRGIGGGCDEEAIRVVEKMPKWNPGKQRGRAVRVLYMVPINFTLN